MQSQQVHWHAAAAAPHVIGFFFTPSQCLPEQMVHEHMVVARNGLDDESSKLWKD